MKKRLSRAATCLRRTARLLISLAVVVSACGGKGPVTASVPASLLPATLASAEGDADGVLRVRVYAGADYRMRLLHWQEDAKKIIVAASELLEEASGYRLELAETIEWKRSGGDLDKTLTSLTMLDPGRDVDLVLGFIDASDQHTDEFAKLLGYEPLGRHVVVRSFHRQAETETLQADLAGLGESEQDKVLAARAHHKQSVLIAAGIAHLFGADNVREEGGDAARYDVQQSRLGPEVGARLRITVPAHLADDVASWSAALRELQAQSAPEPVLKGAQTRLAATQAGDVGQAPVASEMREVDRERLEEARNLLTQHKADEAWARIEKLLELYPDAPELLVPACESSQMREASDALLRCQEATQAEPQAISAWIALALSQSVASAPAVEIRTSLDTAAALLAKAEQPKARTHWPTLARTYQKLSLPRAAQRAAAHAGPASVVEWALESQRRYGTSIGITEASEAAYLDAVKTGLKYVYASDAKRARQSADAIAKNFPDSIGADLIDCEIALRRRAYKASAEACAAVLAKQPDNSWALYLTGVIAGRQKLYDQAIPALRRAIEADPTLKAAYQSLADIYRKTKDPALPALKATYKERFASELK